MSQYGVALDGWWEGDTGRDVAVHGGRCAQILAFYLFKNPDDNMIGLYRARLPVIRERIRTLNQREIERAFGVLAQAEFAEYDAATEHVWVREMANYRLGIYKKPLSLDDNRVVHARGLYERAKENPFLEPFFKRYRRDLHLQKARRFQGVARILGRGQEGACQGPAQSVAVAVAVADSSNTKQITGTGNQQEQQITELARQERAPTRELLTLFDELHQKRFETPAEINGAKDGTLIASLCRKRGPEETERLIRAFFDMRDPWVLQRGFSVGIFKTQIPKLLTANADAKSRRGERWYEACERMNHQPRCADHLVHNVRVAKDADAGNKAAAS